MCSSITSHGLSVVPCRAIFCLLVWVEPERPPSHALWLGSMGSLSSRLRYCTDGCFKLGLQCQFGWSVYLISKFGYVTCSFHSHKSLFQTYLRPKVVKKQTAWMQTFHLIHIKWLSQVFECVFPSFFLSSHRYVFYIWPLTPRFTASIWLLTLMMTCGRYCVALGAEMRRLCSSWTSPMC